MPLYFKCEYKVLQINLEAQRHRLINRKLLMLLLTKFANKVNLYLYYRIHCLV